MQDEGRKVASLEREVGHLRSQLAEREEELRAVLSRLQAYLENGARKAAPDGTQRLFSEAVAEEDGDLFRTIFQRSPAGITISRMRDGKVIEANEAALRMTGFTRQEMIGRSLVQNWVYPERRKDLIRQLKAGESVENLEIALYDRDGAARIYRASFQPIRVKGEPCLLAFGLDVTDQRHAEEALQERDATLRSFYDTVSQMMGVVEVHDEDILHLSDSVASAAYFGTTPEAMRRRLASELGTPPEQIRMWINAYRESKRRGEPVSFEYVREKQGESRWLSATVVHIQTLPTGEDRYSYIIADITDRKRVENELIEAKERAEATARLRKAILNNITHEVRTPLTVIVGFTSMLRRGVQPEYHRFIDRIERSGNRLMLMLDTILDLAQLEAGTFNMVPKPVDVIELVERTVVTLRPQAEEKGLRLEVESADDWLHARLDQRILTRVLNNLLDNAIKFTEKGSISVLAEADDERVYLKIRDTGVGIDEVYLAHVFDEFSQESTGLERTYQGSGLGLAVSQRLIDLAGGTITVESHKGEGSLFTIELPRYDGRAPAA